MGYILIAFSTGTFESMQFLFCYLFLYMVAALCIWLVFLVLQLKYKHIKKQNKDLADLNLLSKSNNILALFFSITVTYISPSSSCKCDADTSEAAFIIAREAFVNERSRKERLGAEYTILDKFRFCELDGNYRGALKTWSSDTATFSAETKELWEEVLRILPISRLESSHPSIRVVARFCAENAELSAKLVGGMTSRLNACEEQRWLFCERDHVELCYERAFLDTPTDYLGALGAWNMFEGANRRFGLSANGRLDQALLVRSNYLSETSEGTWARSEAIEGAIPARVEL